jgi:hypothetical protein
MLSHGCNLFSATDQDNIVTVLCQASADNTPDPARTINDKTHVVKDTAMRGNFSESLRARYGTVAFKTQAFVAKILETNPEHAVLTVPCFPEAGTPGPVGKHHRPTAVVGMLQ